MERGTKQRSMNFSGPFGFMRRRRQALLCPLGSEPRSPSGPSARMARSPSSSPAGAPLARGTSSQLEEA